MPRKPQPGIPTAMSERGVLTVDDLRERCDRDPVKHCWIWRGAVSVPHGHPRIHTFDPERMTKRAMNGPRAAWCIAHGEAPPLGKIVFRCCGAKLCLQPAHLRLARSQGEVLAYLAKRGLLSGRRSVEQNIAAARKGWAAQGITVTPAAVALAIRQAPRTITGRALAAQYGVHEKTVSRIRLGKSHRINVETGEAWG